MMRGERMPWMRTAPWRDYGANDGRPKKKSWRRPKRENWKSNARDQPCVGKTHNCIENNGLVLLPISAYKKKENFMIPCETPKKQPKKWRNVKKKKQKY
mmetsp:Transcript_93390/g.268906  ORF Transcript_93390/g.268906 Transcript_93390/m.268906 type:complete len:99 (+) Transcript_93390:71-367(+)